MFMKLTPGGCGCSPCSSAMTDSSGEAVLTSGANFFRRSGLQRGFNDGGCFGGGGSFLKICCNDSGVNFLSSVADVAVASVALLVRC